DDRSRWLLALEGDQIVGFLRQVTGGEVAQVAALGTRARWRGRGIGTALLRRTFAEMARGGHHEVTLWVDAENETGAVGLYERVGMRAIVGVDTYQRELAGRVAQRSGRGQGRPSVGVAWTGVGPGAAA